MQKQTHRARVRNNVLHIVGGVHLGRGVRAFGGEVGEPGDLEREGLAVDDVPVELVQLHPAHRVQRALDVRHGEAVGGSCQDSGPNKHLRLILLTSSARCRA